MQSLATPKKMEFIGTDGKKYMLLCKANDEMRKDARFLDVNKVKYIKIIKKFLNLDA